MTLLKPINWSEPQKLSEECRYDHIKATTPFGNFLLTWKGWKQYPDFGFDETPWGEIEYHGFNSIESAIKWAENEFTKRLNECLVTDTEDVNVDLCMRVLSHTIMQSTKTGNLTLSEIITLLKSVFEDDVVNKASELYRNKFKFIEYN